MGATGLSDTIVISIVEDDPFVREATRGLVRSLGFAAATFTSAEKFLQSGGAESASCIIADIRMPGLSGLELQQHLISQGHRIPIIFMTAFPDDRIRASALANGAVGFLAKPFKEASLINCIEAALKSRASENPASRNPPQLISEDPFEHPCLSAEERRKKQ